MSNANRCGTCRHWGTPRDNGTETWGLRPCVAVIPKYDVAVLKDENGNDLWDENYEPVPVNTPKAMVVDGSGYFAALKTAEDFGCVLWEAKS